MVFVVGDVAQADLVKLPTPSPGHCIAGWRVREAPALVPYAKGVLARILR
jgi:hypothetical protein